MILFRSLLITLILGTTALLNGSDLQEKAALLSEAIDKNDLAQVQNLLNQGLDCNSQEFLTLYCSTYYSGRKTPLGQASFYNRTAIVKELLAHGVNPDIADEYSLTPLMYVADYAHPDVAKELLNNGANPDIQDKNGCTALMYASNVFLGRCIVDYTAIVKKLLEHGANPNIQSKRGGTALMHAASQHATGIVKLLLAYNAHVNITDEYGRTALMDVICCHGNSSPTETEEYVDYARLTIIEDLLKHGADDTLKDSSGKSALDYAADRDHKEFAEAITAHKNSFSALLRKIKKMYRAYTGKNKVSKEYLLLKAAQEYDLEAVQNLVKQGANINTQDFSKWTPLMHASYCYGLYGSTALVKELLTCGARIDMQSYTGNTALMLASSSRKLDAVKELLAHGANPNIQNGDGQTALMQAASCGDVRAEECIAVIKELLAHGADHTLRDRYGLTVLGQAIRYGYHEIADFLKAHGATE